jgi:hypothetical protein
VKEYDIYVPRNYNDGSPVERHKLRTIKQRLNEQFRGVTEIQLRKRGWWKVGETTFRDKITIFRVFSRNVRSSRRFLRQLKGKLKQELKQEEILIAEKDAKFL